MCPELYLPISPLVDTFGCQFMYSEIEMDHLESQFTNPHGLIGHLVGFIMAFENRERNRWALSLLNILPTDGLLEIGFGPGWAIQHASRIAVAGWVAGVDRSATMVS